MSASFGSLGLVFAGIAAAIWMLVNAVKGLEGVSLDSIDMLGEFISKIWLVLSGSIALIVLAAQGEEVHGIGIAIAALATSLVALKVVFPLMRELAAQKGEFDGAIEAIGLFGAFMLAFAASMFLIQKGSNGLFATLGSIIMLKVYTDALERTIFPTLLNLIQKIYVLSAIMEDVALNPTRKKMLITALVAFGALFALFIAGMAILERTWGEVSPFTFLFIGATIIAVTYMLGHVILPAVEHLLETVKEHDGGDILAAGTLLFLMTLPLLALSHMFGKVIKNIQKIYDNFQNFSLVKVNVGIVTREFNFISSTMQGIMLTIVGVYGAMIAILAIAGHVDWDFGKWSVMVTMFLGAFALIMGIFSIVEVFMKIVKNLSTMGNLLKQSSVIGGGLIKSNEDTLTRVVKSMTGVIDWLLVLVGVIVIASGALAALASETNKANDMVKVLLSIGVVIAAVLIGCYMFLKMLSVTIVSTPVGINTAKTLTAIAGIIGVVGAIFALVVGMALYAADISDNVDKYNAFNDNLSKMIRVLGLSMAAIGILVTFISKALSKNQILSTFNGGAVSNQYRSAAVEVLIVLAGIVIKERIQVGHSNERDTGLLVIIRNETAVRRKHI